MADRVRSAAAVGSQRVIWCCLERNALEVIGQKSKKGERGGPTAAERPVEFNKQPPESYLRSKVFLVLCLLVADIIVVREAGAKVRERHYVLHLLEAGKRKSQLKVETTGKCRLA